MKIYEFINLIKNSFASQIHVDPETNRLSARLIYQDVITWFTDISLIDQQRLNDITMKSENYCEKLLNETNEIDMPIADAGGEIRQCLIWVKNALVLGRQDYQWRHEPILYGWKNGAGHYFVDDRSQDTVIEPKLLDFKKMKKDELIDLLKEIFSDKTSTSVLHEDKTVINDLHPTMKLIKLLARLIKNSSKKGENVLDLFGGSGSTLIACEQLGRNCYMMELDPKYVDIIIKRWELFTGKKAEQIN